MGPHLGCCRKWRCGGASSRDFVGGELPVVLRRRRSDDDVRLDEGKAKVWSTRSGTARENVGKRPEDFGRRRDSGTAGDVVPLRKKEEEGHHRVRQSEGERIDPKGAARSHVFADGELFTAVVTVYSGEVSRSTRDEIERGKRGNRERRVRG